MPDLERRRDRQMMLVALMVAFLTLQGADGSRASESVSTRWYPLAGDGSLGLVVPDHWLDEVRASSDGPWPTIVFRTDRLLEFQVLITPQWSMLGHPQYNTRPYIRSIIQDSAQSVASEAVESDVALHNLIGEAGAGYYYSITDRAPKPDEYAYMTQGAIAVRDLLVIFTILTNQRDSNVVLIALSMVRSALRSEQ